MANSGKLDNMAQRAREKLAPEFGIIAKKVNNAPPQRLRCPRKKQNEEDVGVSGWLLTLVVVSVVASVVASLIRI